MQDNKEINDFETEEEYFNDIRDKLLLKITQNLSSNADADAMLQSLFNDDTLKRVNELRDIISKGLIGSDDLYNSTPPENLSLVTPLAGTNGQTAQRIMEKLETEINTAYAHYNKRLKVFVTMIRNVPLSHKALVISDDLDYLGGRILIDNFYDVVENAKKNYDSSVQAFRAFLREVKKYPELKNPIVRDFKHAKELGLDKAKAQAFIGKRYNVFTEAKKEYLKKQLRALFN